MSLAVGCDFSLTDPDSTLNCLRQKSSAEIVKLQSVAIQFPVFYPFLPTVDGTLVQNHPNHLLKTAKIQNVSVLIGNTEDEGHW